MSPTETATKTTEPTTAPAMEVLPPTGSAIATRQGVPPELEAELMLTRQSEESYLDRLARMEDAAVLFERRAQLLETCHRAALRRTRPQDWVLTMDRQGAQTAMLTISGADLIAELYGIVLYNIGPTSERGTFEPQKVPLANNPKVYTLRAHCSAFSRVNGRMLELVEFNRRSDEEFTGRGVDADGAITRKADDVVGALESDLRGAVMTGMRTKVVRALAGMTRVPVAELEKAWAGTDKKVADCRKGHGYGSGSERGAKGVADADVPEQREKLKKAIISAVGGDASAARQLTLEITANKAKNFKGFDSVDRLTQGWQIDQAVRNLKAHPTFGEAGREPGADDEP